MDDTRQAQIDVAEQIAGVQNAHQTYIGNVDYRCVCGGVFPDLVGANRHTAAAVVAAVRSWPVEAIAELLDGVAVWSVQSSKCATCGHHESAHGQPAGACKWSPKVGSPTCTCPSFTSRIEVSRG